MKKILSILLALGLVLGVSLSALPVGAQYGAGFADWTIVGVTVAPDCELVRATYNITFEAPATLTQGYHSISVRFPEGTGYPAVWRTGHIAVNGFSVFASEITQDGDVVTFLVPTTTAVGPILVQFVPVTAGGVTTGVVNPPAGLYNLDVMTSRAPMSTWVTSGWGIVPGMYWPYLIRPTVSTYAWNLNFAPAYPGIAANFVPPFKACGQDPAVQYNQDSDNPFVSFEDNGRFVTPFQLSLGAAHWTLQGCLPCPNMEAYITMTARPSTTARAHLYEDAALVHNFTSTNPLSPAQYYLLDQWDSLPANPTELYNLGLHFDTVGTYTLCFELIYSGTGVCELGCASVTRCIDFEVKQQKDAISIPLYEKWNLVSLPLVPFDSSIDAMLATLPARTAAQPRLVSVWNYDAFDGEWFVYGAGQDSLTDIVDGKSYWFRNTYTAAAPSAVRVYNWWVFGTAKPQPPEAPSEYPVAEGWNMVGFTSLYDDAASAYLWNWMPGPPLPVVYGWTQGAWTAQGWDLVTVTTDNLETSQGYWMAFPAGGSIFVP